MSHSRGGGCEVSHSCGGGCPVRHSCGRLGLFGTVRIRGVGGGWGVGGLSGGCRPRDTLPRAAPVVQREVQFESAEGCVSNIRQQSGRRIHRIPVSASMAWSRPTVAVELTLDRIASHVRKFRSPDTASRSSYEEPLERSLFDPVGNPVQRCSEGSCRAKTPAFRNDHGRHLRQVAVVGHVRRARDLPPARSRTCGPLRGPTGCIRAREAVPAIPGAASVESRLPSSLLVGPIRHSHRHDLSGADPSDPMRWSHTLMRGGR